MSRAGAMEAFVHMLSVFGGSGDVPADTPLLRSHLIYFFLFICSRAGRWPRSRKRLWFCVFSVYTCETDGSAAALEGDAKTEKWLCSAPSDGFILTWMEISSVRHNLYFDSRTQQLCMISCPKWAFFISHWATAVLTFLLIGCPWKTEGLRWVWLLCHETECKHWAQCWKQSCLTWTSTKETKWT